MLIALQLLRGFMKRYLSSLIRAGRHLAYSQLVGVSLMQASSGSAPRSESEKVRVVHAAADANSRYASIHGAFYGVMAVVLVFMSECSATWLQTLV